MWNLLDISFFISEWSPRASEKFPIQRLLNTTWRNIAFPSEQVTTNTEFKLKRYFYGLRYYQFYDLLLLLLLLFRCFYHFHYFISNFINITSAFTLHKIIYLFTCCLLDQLNISFLMFYRCVTTEHFFLNVYGRVTTEYFLLNVL